MKAAAAAGGILWLALAIPVAAAERADLVLRGGDVYTVDAARSWASAVAVRGGRIVYVGSDAGARPYIGSGTRVIELHGRMLLPGFHDSHVHPGPAGIILDRVQLDGLNTKEAILAAVRRYAEAHPERPWILGFGWNESAFLPSGLPTRQLLDAVVADRPVMLENNSGHAVWLNSKALEAAGVTATTPDPPNGRIERDRDGPTGVLQEDAMRLALDRVPPGDRRDALLVALRKLVSYGVTSVVDAYTTEADFGAYLALEARGELPVRTTSCLAFDPQKDDAAQERAFRAQRQQAAAAGGPRGRLRATCVKILLDGVFEHHTAAVLAPYADDASFGLGPTFVEPGRLNALVTRLDADGFQVHMHTIGDRAVREALDAIAAARQGNGDRDARPTLAHLGLVDPADLPRFRQLGVIANMTPLWSRGDDWETVMEPRVLGAERSQRLLQTASLVRAGAVLVWGTDWPVTSASPLEGLETAITRRFPGGVDPTGKPDRSWFPDERLSLDQAIAAYTIGGAYLVHAERERGSIERGKLADLVVLARNLFDLPPLAIHDVAVDFTIIDGKVVFERPASRAEASTQREKRSPWTS